MTKLIAKIYKIEKSNLNRIILSNTLDYTYLGEPLIILEDNYEFHTIFEEFRDNLWITSNRGIVKIVDIDTLNKLESNILRELERVVDNDAQIILEKILEIFETLFDKLDDDVIVGYIWKNLI